MRCINSVILWLVNYKYWVQFVIFVIRIATNPTKIECRISIFPFLRFTWRNLKALQKSSYQLGKYWRIAERKNIRAEVDKAYAWFSSGAFKEDVEIVGVIADFMIECKWAHARLTESLKLSSVQQLKEILAYESQYFVAFPDRFDTPEEWKVVLLWKKPLFTDTH